MDFYQRRSHIILMTSLRHYQKVSPLEKLHQSMTEMSDFERLIEKVTLICYLVIALSTILLWYGLGLS